MFQFSFFRLLGVGLGLMWLGAGLLRAEEGADNVRQFDKDRNEIAPGRWAYGWFEGGSLRDPRKVLHLFTQNFDPSRVAAPNWAAAGGKPETCWAVDAEGRTYVDQAEVAWIYQVPEALQGRIRLGGTMAGGGEGKELSVYRVADELFTGVDRAALTPLFQGRGDRVAIDATVEAKAGDLLFFEVRDAATPPVYWQPPTLHVMLRAAD